MYDISSPFPAITSLKTLAKLVNQLSNSALKSFSQDPFSSNMVFME